MAYLLGERPHPPPRFHSETLRQLAALHRLDAALAEPRLAVSSPEPFLEPAVWDAWQAARRDALARAISRAAPVRRALAALAPLKVIILKGAAHAELLYPSPAARSLGDVDLLVRANELGWALGRLERLGFRRHHPGDPVLDATDYHERQLGSEELELDLHQGFTQQARLRIDQEAIFDRSLPWPACAPNARLLAPEDAVVHQAIHAACGEFSPDCAPAIGLLDLRQMFLPRSTFWGAAGGPKLDPDAVVSRAKEWGAERMLFATLSLGRRIFPSLAPAAALSARSLSPALRQLIDRVVVVRASPPQLEPPLRLEVLLRKALLLRPSARGRLLRHHLRSLRRRAYAWGTA